MTGNCFCSWTGVNVKSENGRTPLHQVAADRNAEMVRLLMAKFGGTRERRGPEATKGSMLLRLAARGGHVEVSFSGGGYQGQGNRCHRERAHQSREVAWGGERVWCRVTEVNTLLQYFKGERSNMQRYLPIMLADRNSTSDLSAGIECSDVVNLVSRLLPFFKGSRMREWVNE
ncbi:hypothetical protein BC938DRAFT_482744 [Jimgerdemannia flammicorona]|uniref:Uncharacterized protein n=1 Tax=Jimgerdemannia flammicorona TaxID=994334 RepID=A0A433QDE0_9FUNG|nr:hypothetical protein BC938DRAFT_482744 [Jimgerdemannia flammicorona]